MYDYEYTYNLEEDYDYQLDLDEEYPRNTQDLVELCWRRSYGTDGVIGDLAVLAANREVPCTASEDCSKDYNIVNSTI